MSTIDKEGFRRHVDKIIKDDKYDPTHVFCVLETINFNLVTEWKERTLRCIENARNLLKGVKDRKGKQCVCSSEDFFKRNIKDLDVYIKTANKAYSIMEHEEAKEIFYELIEGIGYVPGRDGHTIEYYGIDVLLATFAEINNEIANMVLVQINKGETKNKKHVKILNDYVKANNKLIEMIEEYGRDKNEKRNK